MIRPRRVCNNVPYPDLSKSVEPVTLSLVGLTPMLAVCTTLLGGLAMGFAYLAVLILTGATLSCVARFIPAESKPVYLLLIAAAWVSIIDLLMQAGCYALRAELGIYLYLLAMNTALLFHLKAYSLQRNFMESTRAAMKTALTGSSLLIATGTLRELAAQGGILTDIRLLSHVAGLETLQPAYIFTSGLHLFDTSAGAFIVFGLLLAALTRLVPGRIRSS